MKEKVRKDDHRITRYLLDTKFCSRNLIKGINTRVIPHVKYSVPFLKWTREELEQIEQRKENLILMHNVLQSRDDIFAHEIKSEND